MVMNSVGCAAALSCAAILAGGTARANDSDVLFRFTGGAVGAYPSQVSLDAQGNLYGTAAGGGDMQAICADSYGCGLVFKVAPDGTETILHDFTNIPDGGLPAGGVLLTTNGTMFGTTEIGGNLPNGANPAGTVFELLPGGDETVLYTFTGVNGDGNEPVGPLHVAPAGQLVGTTVQGGAHGFGTVFSVTAAGAEMVRHSFNGKSGSGPVSGVIADPAGNLYGTAPFSGTGGHGVVFKLAPDGTYRVLHNFSNGTDGDQPRGGVIRDAAGNLYGTTNFGGDANEGVLYRIGPKGEFKVLHSFSNLTGGYYPAAAPTLSRSGLLYGTTSWGGSPRCSCGVVYRIKADGSDYAVIFTFQGGYYPGRPTTALVEDPNGTLLYGSSSEGGLVAASPCGGNLGCGTVFNVRE